MFADMFSKLKYSEEKKDDDPHYTRPSDEKLQLK